MKRFLALIFDTIVISILAACASSLQTPTPLTTQVISTIDPIYVSKGGGEPRSAGFWLLWNACVPENKATQAAYNGGWEAGWVIMDDLLEDPGILLGTLSVETCDQGVNLLQRRDVEGTDRQSDAAYLLAAQLLTAQLNLAVGSEYCSAATQIVGDAQLLLLKLEFTGVGGYLGPPAASLEVEEAQSLAEQLGLYNTGELCR